MKETINVSIASRPFTMDKDAYAMLRAYMAQVSRRVPTSDGETMNDLEARISEILSGSAQSSATVVNVAMVDKAISQVGRPEYFGPIRNEEKSYERFTYERAQGRRVLRRSTSDNVIGGVCGGIAEWCNVDSRAVRLLTFLFVLFGGMSAIIYLILWIVLPKDTEENE